MRFPNELTQSAAPALIGPVVFIYERINNRDELLLPAEKEKVKEEEEEMVE